MAGLKYYLNRVEHISASCKKGPEMAHICGHRQQVFMLERRHRESENFANQKIFFVIVLGSDRR